MRGLTYLGLASRYEIDLCADSCGQSGHRRGWVDDAGVVHWNPFRAVTRAGLRRFLMLVAEAHRVNSGWEPLMSWVRRPGPERRAIRIYHASTFASKTALRDLGIRLPASLAEVDKARVRSLLVGAPSELRRSRVGRWAGLR